jgi:hypothetical protein
MPLRPALYSLPSETRAGMTKDQRSSRSLSAEWGDKEHGNCKDPTKFFARFTIGLASEAALQGCRAIVSLRSVLVCADRLQKCCCRRKESMDQEELPELPQTSSPLCRSARDGDNPALPVIYPARLRD